MGPGSLSEHCFAVPCRPVDGALHVATRSQLWPPPYAQIDVFGAYLPDAKHQKEAAAAQGLSIAAARIDD